jgi:hypothetical protein
MDARRFLRGLLVLNLIASILFIQYISFCSASAESEIEEYESKSIEEIIEEIEDFVGFFTLKLGEFLKSLREFFSGGEEDSVGNQTHIADVLTEQKKQALAEKYAPVLYFHRGELWFPVGVEEMLEHSTLKELKLLGDEVKVENPGLDGLVRYNSDDYYLDLDHDMGDWPFDQPKKVYARVFESPDPGGGVEPYLVIQYWFFYIGDNPRFWLDDAPDNPLACNSHEGDWEMIQILFNPRDKKDYLSWPPTETGYSQHYWGVRKSWGDTGKEGDHPIVYIARGSHASYHSPVDLESKCDHAHGDVKIGPGSYMLHIISSESDEEGKWLGWEGHWGEYWSLMPFNSGPPGPMFRHSKYAQGLGGPAYYMWNDPVNWQRNLVL